jgi:hypothetical protein
MRSDIGVDIVPVSHRKAIHFLLDYLEQNDLEYQVTGGLAGNLYGSTWPLVDIDLEVHLNDLYKIEKDLYPYVSKHLHRYVDTEFNIWLLELKIEGIPVDINAIEDFFLNNGTIVEPDLQKSNKIQFDNRTVNVQPLQEIIFYKQLIGRTRDLEELTGLSSNEQM